MPHIKSAQRERILYDKMKHLMNAGELNYFVTRVLLKYLSLHGESYQTYNDIMGVLNCVTIEFYRRLISDYEDIKAMENGDVFDEEGDLI